MFLIKDKYKVLQVQIEELKLCQYEIINAIIEKCNHPVEHIRELPYTCTKGYSKDFVTRPWLICTACGLTEEGWGCGYTKLEHAPRDVPKITYKQWEEMYTRRVYQYDRVRMSK